MLVPRLALAVFEATQITSVRSSFIHESWFRTLFGPGTPWPDILDACQVQIFGPRSPHSPDHRSTYTQFTTSKLTPPLPFPALATTTLLEESSYHLWFGFTLPLRTPTCTVRAYSSLAQANARSGDAKRTDDRQPSLYEERTRQKWGSPTEQRRGLLLGTLLKSLPVDADLQVGGTFSDL